MAAGWLHIDNSPLLNKGREEKDCFAKLNT